MQRKLTAIQIAEGALLADMALAIELLARFTPLIGSSFFFLVPVIFCIIVLRHNLYVGIMSFSVAFFLSCVLSGAELLIPTLFASGAGLFLGFTMKRRLPSLPLIFLGVMGSAFGLCAFLAFLLLLVHGTREVTVRQMQLLFKGGVLLLQFIVTHIGLSGFWQQPLHPLLNWIGAQIVPYWWAFAIGGSWLLAWPLVIITYYLTNTLVRLLGYDVRPFPGGRLQRLARRVSRSLIALSLRGGARHEDEQDRAAARKQLEVKS